MEVAPCYTLLTLLTLLAWFKLWILFTVFTVFTVFTLITLFIPLNLLYTAKTLACTIIYKCTYCEIFKSKTKEFEGRRNMCLLFSHNFYSKGILGIIILTDQKIVYHNKLIFRELCAMILPVVLVRPLELLETFLDRNWGWLRVVEVS